MKKYYPLLLSAFSVLFLSSCNDRFEGDQITEFDVNKIDSVKIAQDTMDVFTTQTIKTFATYSTNCEGFYGYEYLHTSALERQVTSYKFSTDADCGTPISRASQINFRPQEIGVYEFKFWTGKNTAGEDTWLEKTIVVQ